MKRTLLFLLLSACAASAVTFINGIPVQMGLPINFTTIVGGSNISITTNVNNGIINYSINITGLPTGTPATNLSFYSVSSASNFIGSVTNDAGHTNYYSYYAPYCVTNGAGSSGGSNYGASTNIVIFGSTNIAAIWPTPAQIGAATGTPFYNGGSITGNFISATTYGGAGWTAASIGALATAGGTAITNIPSFQLSGIAGGTNTYAALSIDATNRIIKVIWTP